MKYNILDDGGDNRGTVDVTPDCAKTLVADLPLGWSFAKVTPVPVTEDQKYVDDSDPFAWTPRWLRNLDRDLLLSREK